MSWLLSFSTYNLSIMRQSSELNLKSFSELSELVGQPKNTINKIERNISNCVQRKLIKKKNGKTRILLIPNEELKSLLRAINRNLLQPIFLPSTLHGSVPNKSLITNAQVHVAQPTVICIDIKDFYPSIHYSKVYDLYVGLGCSPDVSRKLTRLTTYDYCVPQGFPTSPMLANLILRRLEPRIRNLCLQHELNYSFYLDDLTVSGKTGSKKLIPLFIKILNQCGFHAYKHGDKFRVMTKNQRQFVTGLVVNSKANVRREYIRGVRATINNCLKLGVESQTDDFPEEFLAALFGKIEFIRSVNPVQGEKLLRQYVELKVV